MFLETEIAIGGVRPPTILIRGTLGWNFGKEFSCYILNFVSHKMAGVEKLYKCFSLL